ncbi:LysR family transcriptional regulator [Halomonas aestuarii]|nr:LysR family transcriptional regulator [Halomonas aestuarii]
MTMNIKHLRLFHEIMTTGKMSVAAERMSFSQPAASKMLASLEEQLDYKLFFRQQGRLLPTPEAMFLHAETLNVLQSLRRLEESFERARHGQTGKLTIGTIFGPSYGLLPDVVSDYIDEHPGLNVSLQVMNSGAVCEYVASGQMEVGLADRVSPSNRYEVEGVELPVYCAIHKDHPMAHHDILSPRLLADEPWITLDPESGLYHALQESYHAEGLTFLPTIEVNTSLNALSFVQRGCGVALIDAVNRHYYKRTFIQGDVVFRRFSIPMSEPLSIIWSNFKPLSRPARMLRKQILETLDRIIADQTV